MISEIVENFRPDCQQILSEKQRWSLSLDEIKEKHLNFLAKILNYTTNEGFRDLFIRKKKLENYKCKDSV